MSSSFLPPWASKLGSTICWTICVILLALVAASLWVGLRGQAAFEHLTEAQNSLTETAETISVDPSATSNRLSEAASHTQAARDLTSDPVWALAASTPWLGPQLSALSRVASASDELVSEALLPLLVAAQPNSFESLKPTDGQIDVGALEQLAAPARAAATHAAHAAEAVSRIDRTPLLGVVDSAVQRVSNVMDVSSESIGALADASELMPEMLGQHEPRSYLLLVQNNAEWRSLGGIAGTVALIRADRGRISLESSSSATALSRRIENPVVDLPADLQSIYKTRPARWFHDLTEVPDFTINGPLAREMYRQQTGVQVDGVFAVDPVVPPSCLSDFLVCRD